MKLFYSNNNRDLLASIHKLNCMLDDVEKFTDEDVIMEYVLDKKPNNDFHLARGISDERCVTLVCRICKNDELKVGQAAFFTAVKCETCGYEIGVHEG